MWDDHTPCGQIGIFHIIRYSGTLSSFQDSELCSFPVFDG